MNLVELFCTVDDFCIQFTSLMKKQLIGTTSRDRPCQLSMSEIMTILIHFHQSGYRSFKHYYLDHVCVYLNDDFPELVTYPRFVALIPRTFIPLTVFLTTLFGECRGISFVDSTSLAVCHNKRIKQHKVFEKQAARGKTSMGWFYGFKVHLITNDQGELLSVQITPGNVDDRKPIPQMAKDLWGKLFGDKGYLSKKLTEKLLDQGLLLVTKVRKNMSKPLMSDENKALLRKRAIIETVIDQLKNISQIEHTRHRSPTNCFVNVLCGLIAYCFQPKKPSLHFEDSNLPTLIHN